MIDNDNFDICVTKYLNALADILGGDPGYYRDDESVSAILELISLAKKLESIVKKQNQEIKIPKLNCEKQHENVLYCYDEFMNY